MADASETEGSALDLIDVSDLIAPIDATEPCGPNLDEADDIAFMTYMANAEGLLPASFFKFDRASSGLPEHIEQGRGFAARTHDARLFALLAKLSILNRDIIGFSRQLAALARLCQTHWRDLHPRPVGDDDGFRLSAIQSLDDVATGSMAFQHAPFARHPRLGPLTLRAHLVASGKTAPRMIQNADGDEEVESHPDSDALARALGDIDLEEIIAARDQARVVLAALATLRAQTIEHVGHGQAARFDKLQPTAQALFEWLDGHVTSRDPARAISPPSSSQAPVADRDDDMREIVGGAGGAVGPIASLADCAAALAALDLYFARREPSNPALLLIRQAAQLVGKSYLDALRALAPNLTDHAQISLGRLEGFAIQLERLADYADVAATEEAASNAYDVQNRTDAVALIGMIVAYHARAEPSSPVPLLLERARRMCGQDFMTILKELLPPDANRG